MSEDNPLTAPEPSPEEALRNLAEVVRQHTQIVREHNGRGRSKTYAKDIDAIASAARQLGDEINIYLERQQQRQQEQ